MMMGNQIGVSRGAYKLLQVSHLEVIHGSGDMESRRSGRALGMRSSLGVWISVSERCMTKSLFPDSTYWTPIWGYIASSVRRITHGRYSIFMGAEIATFRAGPVADGLIKSRVYPA